MSETSFDFTNTGSQNQNITLFQAYTYRSLFIEIIKMKHRSKYGKFTKFTKFTHKVRQVQYFVRRWQHREYRDKANEKGKNTVYMKTKEPKYKVNI